MNIMGVNDDPQSQNIFIFFIREVHSIKTIFLYSESVALPVEDLAHTDSLLEILLMLILN